MKLTVVSSPIGGGEVIAEPPLNKGVPNGGTYYPSDNVTLTAVPKRGYRFVNWTGSGSETVDANQSTITIEMNKYYSEGTTAIDITANFALKSWFNWGYPVVGFLALSAMAIVLAIVRTMHPKEPDNG